MVALHAEDGYLVGKVRALHQQLSAAHTQPCRAQPPSPLPTLPLCGAGSTNCTADDGGGLERDAAWRPRPRLRPPPRLEARAQAYLPQCCQQPRGGQPRHQQVTICFPMLDHVRWNMCAPIFLQNHFNIRQFESLNIMILVLLSGMFTIYFTSICYSV